MITEVNLIFASNFFPRTYVSLMKDNKKLLEILWKEIDEEVLSQLPEWFRIPREAYKRKEAD